RAASQVTLLPDPDSPTSPTACPRPIVRSTPCRTRTTRRPRSKSTDSPRIDTSVSISASGLLHLEVAGAEVHREGGRGLPLDVLALAREDRRLVQHGVGGILALADLQHAAEHGL